MAIDAASMLYSAYTSGWLPVWPKRSTPRVTERTPRAPPTKESAWLEPSTTVTTGSPRSSGASRRSRWDGVAGDRAAAPSGASASRGRAGRGRRGRAPSPRLLPRPRGARQRAVPRGRSPRTRPRRRGRRRCPARAGGTRRRRRPRAAAPPRVGRLPRRRAPARRASWRAAGRATPRPVPAAESGRRGGAIRARARSMALRTSGPGVSIPIPGVEIDWWAPPSRASEIPDGVPARTNREPE